MEHSATFEIIQLVSKIQLQMEHSFKNPAANGALEIIDVSRASIFSGQNNLTQGWST